MEDKDGKMREYSILIDGGLHTCTRARSKKEAMRRAQQLWPRGKVEYIGVDMNTATPGRVHKAVTPIASPKSKRVTSIVKPEDKVARLSEELGITETEASLVSQFA